MERTHAVRHTPRLDRLLIKAMQAGGEARDAAWEYIIEHWTNYFVGTIRRYDGTDEDAREMIGEIFEPVEHALCKNRFRYEAPLQVYMNRAVLYRWLSFLKKKKALPAARQAEAESLEREFENLFVEPEPVMPEAWGTNDGTEAPYEDECYQLALRALKREEPLKHTFLIEFTVEGYSQQEIAIKHRKSVQTVKNYVRDAKIFIRGWFGTHTDCLDRRLKNAKP